MAQCPWPGCNDPVAQGRHAIFCVDHALELQPAELSFLTRLKIKATRTTDERVRDHLAGQLPGYIKAAIRRHQQSTTHNTTQGQSVYA